MFLQRTIITFCLFGLATLESLALAQQVNCNCGCKMIKDHGAFITMAGNTTGYTSCFKYKDASAFMRGNGIWVSQGFVNQWDVETMMTTKMGTYNGCELMCSNTDELQEAHPNSIPVVFDFEFSIRVCELFDITTHRRNPEEPCEVEPIPTSG